MRTGARATKYGVEEETIIPQVQTYIHVGQTRVHEAKPEITHGEYEPPWGFTR